MYQELKFQKLQEQKIEQIMKTHIVFFVLFCFSFCVYVCVYFCCYFFGFCFVLFCFVFSWKEGGGVSPDSDFRRNRLLDKSCFIILIFEKNNVCLKTEVLIIFIEYVMINLLFSAFHLQRCYFCASMAANCSSTKHAVQGSRSNIHFGYRKKE